MFCGSPFCRKEFKLDEAVEKFAIYDKWADFEYKFSVQVRYWKSGLSAVFGPSPSFFPSSCFGDLPAPTLPTSHSCDHVLRLGCKIYGH